MPQRTLGREFPPVSMWVRRWKHDKIQGPKSKKQVEEVETRIRCNGHSYVVRSREEGMDVKERLRDARLHVCILLRAPIRTHPRAE